MISDKNDHVLSEYDYKLPENLVAESPADPRDSSRLFAYDTAADKITFDTFSNIAEYLPDDSLVVLNDTKVVPARVFLTRETGGRVGSLFLVNELSADGTVRAIFDREVKVGRRVYLASDHAFEIVSQDQNIFTLRPLFSDTSVNDLLFKYGVTPTPRYIGETGFNESDLREKYQSIFAENPSSVAAPTASLHFTERVLAGLYERGIKTAKITLHVGMGTFAPVREENIADGKLHREYYNILAQTGSLIAEFKKNGRPIVAVGTTVARALETCAGAEYTEIFIRPPYEFKTVDALVTNFHIPRSSLMCLVDAFLSNKNSMKNIIDLYKVAIEEKFRFYSFGDAMLIT